MARLEAQSTASPISSKEKSNDKQKATSGGRGELQEVSVQKHRSRQTRGKDEVEEVERVKPTRQQKDFP